MVISFEIIKEMNIFHIELLKHSAAKWCDVDCWIQADFKAIEAETK